MTNSSGAKSTLQSSKAAVQEEREDVNAKGVPNAMTQGTRESQEAVKEEKEAQGKRGIDPAQEQQQQADSGDPPLTSNTEYARKKQSN